MKRLNPKKLHITFKSTVSQAILTLPRRYTLTHSDRTGDLYLSIGADYDNKQISGLITRFMRDEALAEWKKNQGKPELHVYCHVSGGFVLGGAKWRDSILRREMPLVLEAIRFGDRILFDATPKLDEAQIMVHFQSTDPKFNKIESWGTLRNYK